MLGQIIVKESQKDLTLIIEGEFKKILKADKETCKKVKSFIEDYNSERDVSERDRIKDLIFSEISPGKKIELASNKEFELDNDGNMYLKNTKDPIPEFLAAKLLEYIEKGLDIEALVLFWKRLLLNPDTHVREQLYMFLENNGHPITSKGYFMAYKSVSVKYKYNKETGEEECNVEYDEDTGEEVKQKFTHNLTFKPHHSGNHGMIIKIGNPVTMPREECDNNPERTCSAGLHVGSMEYVGSFGWGANNVILECLISPTDVVSVPVDYNATKMRTCRYYPIAISNGENEEIFLEEDYDVYQKDYLSEEMAKYKTKVEEKIAEISASIKEAGDIVDSLY